MTTGIIVPRIDCVASLKRLTNSPMLTPCWPRAGPTGGAGVAAPPGHCSLTLVFSSFAMSDGLHLPVLELDRGRAAEDRDDHADDALGGDRLVDHAVERFERAFLDLDGVALLEGDLHLRRLLGAALDEREEAVHLDGGERVGDAVRADEVADAGRLAHEEPDVARHLALLVLDHLDEDVAGVELPLAGALAARLDLRDRLDGHEDPRDHLGLAGDLQAPLEGRLHGPFAAALHPDDVPASRHGGAAFS